MDQVSQQSGNESLTYTAPKEPKKSKFLLLITGYFLFVYCFLALHEASYFYYVM